MAVAVAVARASQPPPSVGAPAISPVPAPAAPAAPAPDRSAPAPVPPTVLTIAKLGLTARVDPVGVDARTGDFAVPPSVDVVGWYRYGPGLEAPAGSIVIAGHVDSATQGKGAFFRLRSLAPGDTVEVTGADGRVRAFRVAAREIYPKTSIPLDRYFARDGPPRLTLITCGGPFDASTRRYRDNVVITAGPVG